MGKLNSYNTYYFEQKGITNYQEKDCEKSFSEKAEQIIKHLNPRSLLDVGCATCCLVGEVRKRGVAAWGVYISEYPISQADEDVVQFCKVADITKGLPFEFPQKYDLVSVIDVIEHLKEEEGAVFLKEICKYSDKILFSSYSTDFDKPTYYNIQQQEYWAKKFSEESFFRNIDVDVSFVSPQAVLYEKKQLKQRELIEIYEIYLRRTKKQLEQWKSNSIACNTKASLLAERLMLLEKDHQETINEKTILETLYEEAREKRLVLERNEKETGAKIELLKNEIIETKRNYEKITYAYQQITKSSSWIITRPFRVIMRFVRGFLFYFKMKSSQMIASKDNTYLNKDNNNVQDVNQLISNRLPTATPIPFLYVESEAIRLNLITDSLDKNHLMGGVATALVIVTKLANKYGYPLRIITRHQAADPTDYANILYLNGIPYPKDITFFSDNLANDTLPLNQRLDMSENDVFFATSWWSAEAIKKTSLRKRFFYILQEAETFFYPHGDDFLRCKNIMEDPKICFLVNSRYLWDFFYQQEINIIKHGVYFEPAFSTTLFPIRTASSFHEANKRHLLGEKRKLFFYARPNNPRNLYYFGLHILEEAISSGILDTIEWEIFLVGQKTDAIRFSNGYSPQQLGLLDWKEYSSFLSSIDICLSLMYTPHPSYPPYDSAVSGAVVITNVYSNKKDFEPSKNVLVSELNMESFLQTLEQGIKLAKNPQERYENYHNSKIDRDWNSTLAGVEDFVKECLND